MTVPLEVLAHFTFEFLIRYLSFLPAYTGVLLQEPQTYSDPPASGTHLWFLAGMGYPVVVNMLITPGFCR